MTATATKPPSKLMADREKKLKNALKELGGGKNKVAQSLSAWKNKGVPGDSED